MRRVIRWAVFLIVVGVPTAWFITRASPLDAEGLASLDGDAARGEQVFVAAGCASCHYAPDAEDDAKLILAGGQRFASDFGTFVAPNISPDPNAGIGSWSLAEFVSAVKAGVSPDGQHYYPAFPYASYNKMTDADVVDLWAFWQSLPADATPSQPHELSFPFNIRRSVWGWKFLYLNDDWVMTDTATDEIERGRYLVEALAHCGECHTSRTALGGLDRSNWLAGAPNPSGRGRIPTLAPDEFTWPAEDIAYYLETGFTPDFDSVGGHMAAVVKNFSKLPASDREAVAAYIKALP